jgi:hypothetical protein
MNGRAQQWIILVGVITTKQRNKKATVDLVESKEARGYIAALKLTCISTKETRSSLNPSRAR